MERWSPHRDTSLYCTCRTLLLIHVVMFGDSQRMLCMLQLYIPVARAALVDNLRVRDCCCRFSTIFSGVVVCSLFFVFFFSALIRAFHIPATTVRFAHPHTPPFYHQMYSVDAAAAAAVVGAHEPLIKIKTFCMHQYRTCNTTTTTTTTVFTAPWTVSGSLYSCGY